MVRRDEFADDKVAFGLPCQFVVALDGEGEVQVRCLTEEHRYGYEALGEVCRERLTLHLSKVFKLEEAQTIRVKLPPRF